MIHWHITNRVREALADTPAVLVNGARQTGKSTLVQSEELGEQNRQYLTFDDPSILAAAKGDPNGFVAGLNPRVTLDEIQHVPALFPVIKASIDRKRQPGRFLLTGWANVLLLAFPRVVWKNDACSTGGTPGDRSCWWITPRPAPS